jgi:hypothetical protein
MARIFRKGPGYIIYKIPSYKCVTQALVEQYPDTKGNAVYFEFPQVKKLPDEGIQFPEVTSKYYIHSYWRAPEGLKTMGKPARKPLVRLVLPASGNELIRELRRTLTQYMLKPFKNQLPLPYFPLVRKYMRNISGKSNAVFIMKGEKIVGMFNLEGREYAQNKMFQYLEWSYLDASLTKAERADAHYQASNWLEKNTKGMLTTCGIFPFNVRSQKFHFKLGLRPFKIFARLNKIS